MSLRDYVAALQGLLAVTPFITAISFAYDERPPSAGFIRGSVFFVDGSQLDFKEFLIVQPRQRIVKYGYHYRKGNQLIFRYDNASDPAARNFSTYPHHKHVPAGLLAAEQPSLRDVLHEILTQQDFP
jgi:uncharacterized protein DUF6516